MKRGASADADRAGVPSGLSQQAVSGKAAHPLRGCLLRILSLALAMIVGMAAAGLSYFDLGAARDTSMFVATVVTLALYIEFREAA